MLGGIGRALVKQLPHSLICAEPLDLVLVHFSSAGLQGVEQDLDSFGLLLCEFVLLITNDGRPEARD